MKTFNNSPKVLIWLCLDCYWESIPGSGISVRDHTIAKLRRHSRNYIVCCSRRSTSSTGQHDASPTLDIMQRTRRIRNFLTDTANFEKQKNYEGLKF